MANFENLITINFRGTKSFRKNKVLLALVGVRRQFRHSRPTYVAAGRSFGMRIRLYAAAVRTKNIRPGPAGLWLLLMGL